MQSLRSGFSPFGALRHHLRHGVKRVTRFSGRYVPLRIVFPCHPAVRWDNNPQGTISPKSISMHSVARISPAGGDAAAGGRRGAFPSLAGRLACFPFARRAVVWFYHKGAPSFSRAPTTTFSPERSDATLLYNPWHRGPEGPMDAIRPSEPKAQAPSGIQASTAPSNLAHAVGVNLHARRACHSPIKKEAAKAASFFNFISDQPGKPSGHRPVSLRLLR